jgi:hypothetical protein
MRFLVFTALAEVQKYGTFKPIGTQQEGSKFPAFLKLSSSARFSFASQSFHCASFSPKHAALPVKLVPVPRCWQPRLGYQPTALRRFGFFCVTMNWTLSVE